MYRNGGDIMNEKEGVNILDFLATGINKEDPVIKAIFSDENGEGAIANEAEKLSEFIKYYTRTDQVNGHKGTSLEMLVKLFAKLQRRVSESDSVLIRRLFALTYRKGDSIWGDRLDLKHVFESYFNGITCHVAENTNGENILTDGDFEEDRWALGGGAVYDFDSRFSGSRGVLFSGIAGEVCRQVIEYPFTSGNHTFHFMLKGKCGVTFRREDGKYWNANDQRFSGETILEWVDDEYINIFEKENWEDVFCFLVMPDDANSLTIEFTAIEGNPALIDYARLFVKPLNPSYTLIFQYSGYSAHDQSLHIGIDGEEPIVGLDYSKESYFDVSFIIGPAAVSQSQTFVSVLEKVKPCGIQVFSEFVEKKEFEEEI